MITILDLRIGNYYLHRFGDGEATECKRVTAQLLKDMESQDEEVWYRRHWPEPIPITEAVLMAAGFARKIHRGSYPDCSPSESISFVTEISGVDLTIRLLEWGWYINMKKRTYPGHNFIEAGILLTSLHYIQNLIYSITGRELEIDLEKLKEAVK